ncbi:DNA repair protein [Pasteurella multocida]|uniref:DNA repair protein n=1 Tax=Pasteurella multocida TaxID=747 RepID=UPI00111B0768|nr:DNA repair protein [Pasteurella multocida]MDY0632150.1 DNA repair protein [Pasteurella multocida]QDA13427.1 DNA repair protein [Pasteurella multocida subsp. multocida]
MAKSVCINQIERKIRLFESEREQVVKHLALVDDKLQKLRHALEVLEYRHSVEEYNTANFTYKLHQRHFKGKLRKMVLEVLKQEPHRYFTVFELISLVLIKDGQANTPITAQHTVSMRGALKHWLKKGVVERLERSVTDIRWKLAG